MSLTFSHNNQKKEDHEHPDQQQTLPPLEHAPPPPLSDGKEQASLTSQVNNSNKTRSSSRNITATTAAAAAAKKRTADGAFKTAVDAISRMKQAPITLPSNVNKVSLKKKKNADADHTDDPNGNTTAMAGTGGDPRGGRARQTFQQRLEELKAYGKAYGTVNVPQTCKINPSLGRWCHNMKYVYKRKTEGKSLKGYLNITDEQVQELKNIGFIFAMSEHTPRKSFEERLVQLQDFQKLHGHVTVPSNYKEDPSLGHWVGDVRRGNYSLTDDQRQILTAMGFDFTVKARARNKNFEERLQECIEFKKIHGHPNVPQGYKHNPLLGQWCDQIRKTYAKLMDSNQNANTTTTTTGNPLSVRLNQPKIQMLKDIGFDFEYKTVDRKTYEERLAEIKEYYEKHGHANIPASYKENPGLGMWVANLRSSYKRFQKDKINYKGLQFTEERLKQLSDVGFDFDMKCGKTFEERVEELKEFKAKYGDLHVAQKYKENPSLGSWCANMRTAYRRKQQGKPPLFRITEDRIKILEDLGFEFSLRSAPKDSEEEEEHAEKSQDVIDAAIEEAVINESDEMIPSEDQDGEIMDSHVIV